MFIYCLLVIENSDGRTTNSVFLSIIIVVFFHSVVEFLNTGTSCTVGATGILKTSYSTCCTVLVQERLPGGRINFLSQISPIPVA